MVSDFSCQLDTFCEDDHAFRQRLELGITRLEASPGAPVATPSDHDRMSTSTIRMNRLLRRARAYDDIGEPGMGQERKQTARQTNHKPNGTIERAQPQGGAITAGPPDGGTSAWTQVLASFLINMNVYGLVNAFGEFQHFYETEYLTSYSSSTISWMGTVQGSFILFVGALAGPIFDKGYFMITLQCSTVALIVSWMLLSVSKEYYQVCS